MANKNWKILFATFIVSCVAFALYIVSISTANWVEAVASYKNLNSYEIINYGLFSGTIIRHVLAARWKFDLTVVCDYSESACMYSCQDDSDTRKAELNNILNGDKLKICPSRQQPRSFLLSPATYDFAARDEEIIKNLNREYIPAGYWLCTVLFLSFAIVFTAVSSVLSLVNVVLSPVEPILNIFGLYIWNGIAAGFSLLALILWRVLFNKHLINNIAITDTLNVEVTFISTGNASIGFCYYIMLVAFILNLVNIGLLVLRIYLAKRNAEPPTITIDKDDAPLEFY